MSVYTTQQLLDGAADVGTQVTVQGWIRTRRDSKAGFSFLHISDGSGTRPIQAIADNTLDNYDKEIRHLTSGCAVSITGELVESKGKGQSVEIVAATVNVIGWVEDPDTYPIQPKEHSYEFLREVAHLRPRTNTFASINRIRHRVAQAIHRFFDDNGFYWVNTPIITASDAEGAGELFRVSTLDLENLPRDDRSQIDFSKDFFSKESFLTVSGQLNVEAFCLSMSKVYTFGPTFRAENSNTSRHLAEFWMVEPEIAFANLTDNANLAEEFLKYVFSHVLDRCADDMEFLQKQVTDKSKIIKRLEELSDSEFARMEYTEAIDLLKKVEKKFEFPVNWGMDLQTEHERFLSENYARRPVIVMNYPKDAKAFYMRRNEDGRTVAAMDVLAPGIGEIIGGSQREERFDVLTDSIIAQGMQPEDYDWYLDLRKYGSVPHAGFGLGFERLISYITGMANIRDVIPYPRVPGSARF